MLIWGPLFYFLLIGFIIFYIRRPSKKVPIFVNGMIPGLPGAKEKPERGSTVLIYYSDEDPKNAEKNIFKGYANEKGQVTAIVPVSSVGRKVTIRIRHAPYLPLEVHREISRLGVVFTAKMIQDGTWEDEIRGADVEDLEAHFGRSLTEADNVRFFPANIAKILGRSLAEIPMIIWGAAYFLVIISNAADFYSNWASFEKPIESFVHSIYFSVITITTLGYGDSYPINDLLRLACSVESILGVLLIGLFLNSLFYERK